MLGTDIQSYVEGRLGRTFEADTILTAINECLDEISDMSLLYATSDVTVSDTTQWYALPETYSKVEKVIKYEDDEEYIYENWEYRNGSIRLFDEGSYIIVARKMPDYLTEIADSFSELHRSYNNAIKYYVLAWVRENEDLDDQTAQVLYKRFRDKLNRSARILIGTKSPAKWKVIRNA